MEPRFTLASLLSGIDARISGDADIEITGIAYDSRHVAPGDVFVAVPGFVHDGLRFVADAVAAGAVAVIAQASPEAADLPSPPTAWARVADARRILAPMAARFYGDPSKELTVVGVTGTNGKTTTTALLEKILATRGPTGRWSTTTVSVAGASRPAHRTTPEGPDLQAALRQMVDAGCWAAAIEVSSHALSLHRVDGTRFAAGVFTNLSGDHMDFHQDMDEYLDAKAMLFERLEPDGVAVLNVGDPASAELASRTRARVIGYGWLERPLSTDAVRAALSLDEEGNPPTLSATESLERARCETYLDAPTYWIRKWGYHGNGSRLRLAAPDRELELETPLFGPANAENLAAAIATSMELGLPADDIIAPVAAFQGSRGRFQRLMEGQPFAVLVDFAHTPAALEAALAAARALAGAHRVLVVFGAGGDRDRGKRPAMGKAAAAAADQVLITSDNPRSEDPDAIIDEIVAGIPSRTGAQIEREADRKRAIERALNRARPGDCVLIAGKGHEREQVFADRTIPFDDVAVATDWLRREYPRRPDGSPQGSASDDDGSAR
jgi:UDP-N-acetylmuramoyl-L-alanyl-D-glutamate--2,6-diaminopimelate ligase